MTWRKDLVIMQNQDKNQKRRKRGYTLTEMLTVIAIIAVLCAIMIPSFIYLKKALDFKRANDYAKSVFMAAQANLTELRSDGGLAPVQSQGHPVEEGKSGFPAEDWSDEYRYITSSAADAVGYSYVLPVGSIDGTVRSQQVIIEYNPITGNVYSVFYCEDAELDIFGAYADSTGLPRNAAGDKAERKKMMLGYYDGSGLSSSRLELEESEAQVAFENGQEAVVTVMVPMPSAYYGKHVAFQKGLEVDLTVLGDHGGEVVLRIKESGNTDNCKLAVDGKTILLTYTLDSLADQRSFANLSAGVTGASLTTLKDANFDDSKVKPGDNVTIIADVRFYNASDEVAVKIKPGMISDVNPMFEALAPSATAAGKYILQVANGRNLQNLNAIHPDIAKDVDLVSITDDIYWNATVAYYNDTYGTSGTYQNSAAEAPARALPYFVPIHSDALFGSAQLIFPLKSYPDNVLGWIAEWLDTVFGSLNEAVPTLTDENDNAAHASISGRIQETNAAGNTTERAARVYYLNIDTTRYPTYKLSNAYYAGVSTGLQDTSRFAGLFGYANTNIDSVHVVNSVVKGYNFNGNNNPAAGSLLGCGGYNTLVTNCAAYIDTQDAGFSRAAMTQGDYNATGTQTWYGVSGEGSVGGLVGYAKSHRTITGDLVNDTRYLAFSNCFAAVNVSGNMRGFDGRDSLLDATVYYGYSNGVGGFIGNSELTNFYNCYASGNVRANNCYIAKTTLDKLIGWIDIFGSELDLLYSGRTCMGGGGFVGTSHGTRYTNCFATGSVTATNTMSGRLEISNNERQKLRSLGAGGFVGVMSIDETKAYGHDNDETEIAQRTVFTQCYSVGVTRMNGGYSENFSGANARVKLELSQSGSYLIGDYYELYAPHYALQGQKEPDYEDVYIYRDTYYLSSYYETDQSNSNNCASAEPYSTFTDLPGSHRDMSENGWVRSHIQAIKDIVIVDRWLQDDLTYNTQYFSENAALDGIYVNLYKEGYNDGQWEAATTATTHPYSQTGGGRYPFTKLTGLDYYGDWPSKPSSVGLAYYEDYRNASGENHRGFYYDRDNTATITEDSNAVILSDGFAVLSATQGNITVTVNGYTATVAKDGMFYPGNVNTTSPYHVFPLPQAVLEAAAAACNANDELYAQLTIRNAEGDTYTAYFNPYIPQSQVNPTDGRHNAEKPDAVPDTLYIRTARQLAGLGEMEHIWDEDYDYIQQLDIEATTYTAESYSTNDRNAILDKIDEAQPMGTVASPFAGSYTGAGGYVKQASISGFGQLFGTVGETGQVKNLKILVNDNALTINAEDTKADSAALVAGRMLGSIDNVDLLISKDISLTAPDYAGLMAGYCEGKIVNCEITVTDATVTVIAENAGGFLGAAKGPDNAAAKTELGGNLVTITGKLVLGDENTVNAGAYAGALEAVSVTNVTLTLPEVQMLADYAGGFAGSTVDSDVTAVTVTAANNLSNTAADSYTGGLVGSAKNGVFTGIIVDLQGDLSGCNVAGLLGKTEKVTVQNCQVSGKKITGTSAAAGLIVDLGAGSLVQTNTTVELSNGSITSDGSAAGYVVNSTGEIVNGLVMLDNVTISGGEEAAGFVCAASGDLTNCSVTGSVRIASQGNAGGFAVTLKSAVGGCFVTPAKEDTAAAYKGNSNANLEVSGTAAVAGFAVNVEESARINNCYVLGTVSGVPAGFAVNNKGTIDGCAANVTLTGGSAFVAANEGTVINSYGWYGDGNGDTLNIKAPDADSGTYLSCYFVDIDVKEIPKDDVAAPAETTAPSEATGTTETTAPAEPEETGSVTLYDHTGAWSTMMPSALQTEDTLWALNGDADIKEWRMGGYYASKPYSAPGQYLYPMLRDHRGDWVVPPQYSYGVLYYEVVDGSLKMHILDLFNYELMGNAAVETNGWVNAINTTFDKNEGTITEAGYAVFAQGESNPFANLTLGEKLAHKIPGKANRYNLYKLAPADSLTMTLTTADGRTTTLTPWYADAFGNVTTYNLRTEEQWANMTMAPAASFTQTHDIRVAKADHAAVPAFSGTYTGNGLTLALPSGANTWITAVSGQISNLTLITGDVANPIFSTVSGSIALNSLTMENAQTVIGTVSSGTVGLGSVKAKAMNGNLIGTLSGGTVTTGNITLDSLNASLLGSCTGGTLQGGENGHAVIQVGALQGLTNLFAEKAAGTIRNYQTSLNVGTVGLVSELSGTMNNVTLAVTANEMTADVVKTLNGSLSGLAVSVTGTMSGNLIETANTSVNGLTLYVTGNMTDNAIDAAYGDVTNLNLTVTGTLGGSLIGMSAGNIGKVSVQAEAVAVTAEGNFGVITAELAKDKALSESTVKINRLDITVGKQTSIGGLVGVNNGTIYGCTLSGIRGTAEETPAVAAMVDNAAGKHVVLGGLVGTNYGAVGTEDKPNDTKVDITYIQPILEDGASAGEESATIGGIVGMMNTGALTRDTVSGSILLTNADQLKAQESNKPSDPGVTGETEEPFDPADVESDRAYIVGGAVGNLFAGVARNAQANVVIDPGWMGALVVESANTFGTSGIVSNGPVGMFTGFAGAVTIENCASVEKTNETFQFLGEAMIGELAYRDGTWISTVKAESILSYSDSLYCNGNVYTSANDTAVTVAGKSSADKYTGIVTNLAGEEGCTFYLNGVQNTQSYGCDLSAYSKTDTPQNGYKATQLTGTLTQVGVPEVRDLKNADSTNGWEDTKYFVKIGDQYYRLGVKIESTKIGIVYRDYDFARYINGAYEQIGSTENTTTPHNRKLDDRRVSWTNEPEAYYTFSVPSLDAGKQYLVVNGNGNAYGSTGNASEGVVELTFATAFKQRDIQYQTIWNWRNDNGRHVWTTLAHGMEYVETSPNLRILNTVNSTSPAVKYTIGGAVCDLYVVEVDPAGAYNKVVFTYLADAAGIREYITCTPTGVTASTESNLPGQSGEAPVVTESVESTEVTAPSESTEPTEPTEPTGPSEDTNN